LAGHLQLRGEIRCVPARPCGFGLGHIRAALILPWSGARPGMPCGDGWSAHPVRRQPAGRYPGSGGLHAGFRPADHEPGDPRLGGAHRAQPARYSRARRGPGPGGRGHDIGALARPVKRSCWLSAASWASGAGGHAGIPERASRARASRPLSQGRSRAAGTASGIAGRRPLPTCSGRLQFRSGQRLISF